MFNNNISTGNNNINNNSIKTTAKDDEKSDDEKPRLKDVGSNDTKESEISSPKSN